MKFLEAGSPQALEQIVLDEQRRSPHLSQGAQLRQFAKTICFHALCKMQPFKNAMPSLILPHRAARRNDSADNLSIGKASPLR